MLRTKTMLRTTASAMCLCSAVGTAAQAQDFILEEVEEVGEVPTFENEVELGGGYVSDSSEKFGQYTGLDKEGGFVIGNFRLQGRAPYDSESTTYYGASGRNLGLDSRSLDFEFGEQGRYDLFLRYEEIPFLWFEGKTPYRGVGSDNLTLPGNWVAAPTTDGFTALAEDNEDVDIKTKRKRFSGGASWRFLPNWSIAAEFQHEKKDGLGTIGGAWGTNGGNPSAVILPQTIEYDTNTVDVALEYAGKRSQVALSYEYSSFNDKNDSMRFQNPYSTNGRGGPWAPETGYPTGFGEFALPPDNTAQQVALTGAYTFGATTRVTGHASYRRMEQNENLLPYSAIPALQASVTTPLPRNSADAKINEYLVDLGVTSRPLPKLDVRAKYQYDRRDDDTPEDVFVYITGDAETQPAGTANANARKNLGYDYQEHTFELETGYEILPRTKATLGYEFNYVDRDYQAVTATRENTFTGRLSSSPVDFASGWVEYGHGFRNGSSYESNRNFVQSHTNAYIATLPADEQFENHPALEKFTLADRDRDFVNARVDFFPIDQVGVGLSVGYILDNYNGSELGLIESSALHTTIDVSYSPREDLTGFAYFTYEYLEQDQKGHSWNTANMPSLSDPSQDWRTDTEDKIFTAGVGTTWAVIKDVLTFTTDYVFTHATTSYNQSAGSALDFAPLPDVKTTLHSVGANLEYAFLPNVAINLGYRFEHMQTDDFAVDGIKQDTVPFVLGIGRTSPNYSVHVIGASLKVKF